MGGFQNASCDAGEGDVGLVACSSAAKLSAANLSQPGPLLQARRELFEASNASFNASWARPCQTYFWEEYRWGSARARSACLADGELPEPVAPIGEASGQK